jgi:BASS family bile acid:Na+ symporter
MTEVVRDLTNAFTLAFVVTSMFSLGLSTTIQELLAPFKNVRLLLLALLANFVIVPLVAFALTRILPLDQDLQTGILLLGMVAGAPFAIKATQIAKGDVTLAGSLVVLLVVVTVIYLPLVLPLLLPGVQVDAVAVALPLIIQILLPLAAGLLMNYRYDEEAVMTRPIMGEIANISLALMLVLNLANVGEVLGFLGTGAILAVVLVVMCGLAAGYFLGGAASSSRRTLAIATSQRNYAAALVIANGNFSDRPTVIILLLAASLISMILLVPIVGEFSKRSPANAAVVKA